jgi:multiple antibiotic resistance protein
MSDSIFSIALTLFLVANPIGNAPAIIALIKDFDFSRQKAIMLREAAFSLLLALFFQYFGEVFLSTLHVERYTVSFCGGTLLFLISLTMVFPLHHEEALKISKHEPFFVPIATPILSGPGLLSMIMLLSTQVTSNFAMSIAILIAWCGVTLILVTAPYLNKFLGKRGLLALEQLMGMILSIIATSMLVKGAEQFISTIRG